MSQAPVIKSCLAIGADDLDPDAITQQLGLEPTRIWRQKRKHLEELSVPNTQWVLEIETTSKDSVSEALDELIAVLWPIRDRVRELAQSASSWTWFVSTVIIHEDRPLYDLQPATIEKLAYWGCEWNLDIYDYSE